MKKSRNILLAMLSFVLVAVLCIGVVGCGSSVYTVSFDPNYSGAQITEVEVESGGTVEKPADPERDGYRFDGWFAEKNAQTPFEFTQTIEADTVVYAGWTQVYTITFDLNYDGGTDSVSVVPVGDKLAEPEAPERAGYAFKGWFTSSEGGAEYNFNSAPIKDMTLYAHWAEAYTITLDYNYEGAPANGTYYAEKGAASAGPEDPVREGYGFNGWYTDAACTTSFSFARPITSDTTIYAGWKEQLVMEAEYVDFTGKSGPGYSGNVSGTEMIGWDKGGTLGASNGYYVSYLYRDGQTLTFNFNSSAAVNDADIVLRITAEFYDQTFSSENYSVVLNGSALPWGEVTIAGTQNPAFIDVVIGKQLTLKEGGNVIELVTNNSVNIGGTMAASAPMVDCIKIASSAVLTWTPLTGNIE